MTNKKVWYQYQIETVMFYTGTNEEHNRIFPPPPPKGNIIKLPLVFISPLRYYNRVPSKFCLVPSPYFFQTLGKKTDTVLFFIVPFYVLCFQRLMHLLNFLFCEPFHKVSQPPIHFKQVSLTLQGSWPFLFHF